MLVPLRSVFSMRPASFVTVGSPDDAVRGLAVVVKRSVWQEWAVDCLIGRVSADYVEVRRHRAGSRDPLPAVLLAPSRQLATMSCSRDTFATAQRAEFSS
jgi:hypothetical protein